MRLDEIDDKDRSYAATAGINLDIDRDFIKGIEILNFLIKLKSPYRNNYWLPLVTETEDNLHRIINSNFADDISTKELKEKALKYLQEIDNLKSQL